MLSGGRGDKTGWGGSFTPLNSGEKGGEGSLVLLVVNTPSARGDTTELILSDANRHCCDQCKYTSPCLSMLLTYHPPECIPRVYSVFLAFFYLLNPSIVFAITSFDIVTVPVPGQYLDLPPLNTRAGQTLPTLLVLFTR